MMLLKRWNLPLQLVRGCLARLERLEHQTRLDLFHGHCQIEVSQNVASQNDC
jgi:hypothetical protein